MDDINIWLQDPERDYEEGVRLLQHYGRNRQLQQHLHRKETKANWQKLEYELQKLSETEPVRRELEGLGMKLPDNATIIIVNSRLAEGQGSVAQREQVHVGNPTPPPELSPAVRARLEELSVESGRLYTEQAQASNRLASLPTDEARLACVEEIEQLKNRRDALALERQRLEAGGALLLEETTAPVPSLAELVQHRNNLRATVSKAKKSVEKARSDDDRLGKEQRLAKVQLQLQEAEMQVRARQLVEKGPADA